MLYTWEYLLIMLITSVWSVRGLDYVRKNIRWWQISFKFQWIHMFRSGSVLVAILVQQNCASASYLPLYQAPSVLGMQWTSSPSCCAIWLRLLCMWRIALPPCACQSLEVWLQSLWGDWLCKELNCVCCGHKGHVNGDAQIQHCACDCFDRRQWIVLLGDGNSATALSDAVSD